MWFEDRSRSQSNMKVSSLIVEEWRDIWSTKPEFMFAALAYLFATTNLINLPRLILENGGPAFLVAYGASLLAVVLPILLLELSVGQLTGRAPVQSFYNICPALKGVGLAQILFSIIVMACMTRFLGWVLFYIYHLLWTLADDRPGLPWLHCLHFPEFHFGDCLESASPLSTAGGNGTLLLGTHSQQQGMATLHPDSAMAQFGSVLDAVSDSIDQPVQIQLHWLVAHGTIWALVFCAICFGVRWLGKVVLFTLTVPLLLLMALCGRALLLDGAPEMFRQLLVDALDWERLKDVWLWKTAVEQAILACGLGFGAFITMGSYNKRSNNLVKDGFLLLIGHCMISVLQVATVVALVGHVSQRVGLSANDLLQHGEHQFHQLLVYFAYISHTKLFTAIFLFMVAFALLNIFFLLSLSVLATLEDALGEKWSRCCPRFTLAMLVCAVGFAASLYFTTEAGKHGYELATGYLKYATLAAILASELFTVAWLFGAHSLGLELRQMLHSGCSWCMGHFLLLFTYLLPAVPVAIACLNLMGYSYAKYSPEVRAWPWSEWAGIGIAILPLLPIPLWKAFAIVQSCRRRPRISYCRRIGLAFRSPLRHELMKSSMMSSSVGGPSAHLLINPPAHNNHNQQQRQKQLSPRYSAGGTAAVNSGGYMLLPQAPLAQPEPDDAVGGPESGRSVGGGGGGSARHQHQQQEQPTAHHPLSTSTSTLRAADSSSTSVRRTGSEHGPFV